MSRRTNRELVMLATELEPRKHRVGGMYVSEKLDGVRAIWLPAARGISVDNLPFANIEKDTKIPKATGLFSRYGKVIYAPASFLDSLPTDRCLDGELFTGRQLFQKTLSTVRKHEPNLDEWQKVKYMVFDSPNYNIIFQTGRINNPIFKKNIDQQACLTALGITEDRELRPFDFTFNDLEKNLNQNDNVKLHKQMLLPFSTESALAQLEKMLSEVTDEGAEGLILRHPAWPWEPIRSGFMCKYKLQKDAEGVIKGFIAGKGKHHGRLGSIRLSFNSLDFDVGGFTDEERELSAEGKDWAERNPGAFTFNPISSHFFLGSILTFKYRELTDRGIPKEARYLRPKMKGF